MKIKSHVTLLFVLMGVAFGFAQTQLSGSVIDANGEPIPGATIIVQETNNGTTSDFDGNFSIAVDQDQNLEISYLGYTTQIVQFTGQDNISVSLVEDQNELDEIIVTGYGTRKKSHLTGAIAKIGGGELAAVQVARVDDALAGKLSGVLIQNQSGEPGADPKIQIRAASSISGNINPLVVVDGYPISGGLASINPNDIESLEVLKDAASAAIYGSRGANGVILITTKKGKKGKASFSYNGYTSFSNKYRENILMTGPEWAGKVRSEITAGNWSSDLTPALLEFRLSAYEDSPDVVSVEDWLYQSGSTQSHDLNVSGGSEDVNYFASVGYQNTDGIARTQNFERLNARLSIDAKLSNKFKAGLSFNGSSSNRAIVAHDMRDLSRAYSVHPIYHTAASIAFVQQLSAQAIALGQPGANAGVNGGALSSLGYIRDINDLVPGDFVNDWHYGNKGKNGIGGSGDQGPATKLDNAERTQKTFFANINSYLEYEILDGLNIKTVLGADIKDTQDYYYQGLQADAKGRTNQTDLDQSDVKYSTRLSETTLNYAKVFGKHDLAAVVGLEYQKTTIRATSLQGTNLPSSDVLNFSLLAPEDITVRERDETRSRESVFGRINYAYDDRYLASVSVRRDGDSRFGKNNRFETFPALSLGWNIHKEEFFGTGDVFNKLKIRVSTGSLGTASFLGSYSSLSLLNAGTSAYGTTYLIPSDIANPDLTWQTNTETNYGIDLGFLNNRFSLSIDSYTSDIKDILINQSVSQVLGTSQIKLNSGDVESSGLEFDLRAGIINTPDFTWNINANLSTVETTITDLGGLDELSREYAGQSGRDIVFRNYVGGNIGEMWGLETTGQLGYEFLADPSRHPNYSPGLWWVKDQQSPGEAGYGSIDNTKTVAEGGDLVKVGQNTPDFYWGLNSSMTYREFDLSIQMQGSHGAEVYNIDPYYYGSQWGTSRMLMDDVNAYAAANGLYYKDAKGRTDSNIQDASYVAIRNLTIGYTFDRDLINKIGLSSVRVYGAATNLLYVMADDYTSYNPEGIETTGDYSGPTSSGFQVGASPIARSFSLGLNINF